MRRLKVFDLVEVAPPAELVSHRSGPLRCDVIAMVGRTAALDPRDVRQLAGLPQVVRGAWMLFDHQDAPVAPKGALQQEEQGYLRFSVGDGVVLDRRRATRAGISLPVSLRRPHDGAQGEGMTLDVSADGLLAAVTLPVAVGDRLVVTLSLPGDDPLAVEATVARESDGVVGMELSRGNPAPLRRLGALVLHHNRAVIHRRRG